MDLAVLKKKISTFKTETGRLMSVSDEVLIDLLAAWENWTGPAKGFYSALGSDHRKLATLIGRAKKLKRDGHFPESDFKEISVQDFGARPFPLTGGGIELILSDGQIVRFGSTDLLLDFLNKIKGSRQAA